MSIIICYATCWACKFDDHLADPHTWMDADDIEFAPDSVTLSNLSKSELAAARPCGCYCQKRAPK